MRSWTVMASVFGAMVGLGLGCTNEPDLGGNADSGGAQSDATVPASDGSANDSSSSVDSTATGSDGSSGDGGGSDTSITTDGGSGDGSSGDGSAHDAKADVNFFFDAGADGSEGDGAFNPDAACVESTVVAAPVKLDMYFMVDRSGSMAFPIAPVSSDPIGDCNVGDTKNSKWCYSINALSQFFNSVDQTDNAAALAWFSINNAACTGVEYSTPVVPAGSGFITLPSTQFDSALNAQTPYDNTPTIPAIKGTIQFTANQANRRVGRKLVSVFVTDGDPNGCNVNPNEGYPRVSDIPVVKSLLQQHYVDTNVVTYIIGMDGLDSGGDSRLETMAQGGNAAIHNNNMGGLLTNTCGSSPSAATCRHWNIGTGTNGALVEALKQIQKMAIACSYALPQSDAGLVDPARIRVQFQPSMGTAQTVGKVLSVAGCTGDGGTGGWYYDDNMNPHSINLCASTCQTVEADVLGKVNIVLGCQGS